MNIGIIGSRDISLAAEKQIKEYIMKLPSDSTIITGAWYECGLGSAKATRGADRAALEGAIDANLPIMMAVANAVKNGTKAGLRRNHDVVRFADKLVAFWDGKSTGTAHTIGLAKKAGVEVEIILI